MYVITEGKCTCTYIRTYMHQKCTQAHTNLIKVDIQSCSGGLHSIVQLPQSPQCVGEPHKPDITVNTRTHVDGTAVTLNGLTRVTHNTPVQTGQGEQDPRRASLQGDGGGGGRGMREGREGISWWEGDEVGEEE